MKKNLFFVAVLAAMMLGTTSCSDNESGSDDPKSEFKEYRGKSITLPDHFEITPLADRVISLGTYTEVDEDKALSDMTGVAPIKAGCSTCCKVVSNGDLLVCRNNDLSTSDAPIYVFKTSYGKYKTMNLMYFYSKVPSYTEVLDKGLSSDLINMIPYMSCDVLNEKGLYMASHMRPGETDENGKDLFVSTGTNPGKKPVYLGSMVQYLSTRCATVDDVLAEIKNLNISSNSQFVSWPMGIMVADRNGRHGVLEVINNEVCFADGADAHTNFFINEKYRAMEKGPQGIGRYNVMKEGLPSVNDEMDIHNLMAQLYYSYMYRDYFFNTPYLHADFRSEFALGIPLNEKGELDIEHGDMLRSTTEWVQDSKNEAVVTEAIKIIANQYLTMSEAQRRATLAYWVSTIHNVVNVNNGTMTFQLWEDPYLTFTMKW